MQVILAQGGFQVPRLLLASDRVAKNGLGTDNADTCPDHAGTYDADHTGHRHGRHGPRPDHTDHACAGHACADHTRAGPQHADDANNADESHHAHDTDEPRYAGYGHGHRHRWYGYRCRWYWRGCGYGRRYGRLRNRHRRRHWYGCRHDGSRSAASRHPAGCIALGHTCGARRSR